MQVRSYYNNDNIQEDYFHIDTKKQGLYTLYDYNGFKIRTVEYVDGNKNGEYVEYHRHTNDIYYKCIYYNNLKVGDATFYYENGNIDNICYYLNGKISGMRYWYYEDNTIKKHCNYIDGLIQGQFMYYKLDGTIKHFWNYVDDEIVSSQP